VAFDPTDSKDLARLRRIRRVALTVGGLLSVLVVLAFRRCS
jgi:hypothetical protein